MGFCWPWIPEIGELAKPLTEATKNEEMEAIEWGPGRDEAYKAIKANISRIFLICTLQT